MIETSDKAAMQKIPNHLAVIMDGNGRWAQRQGKPRIFGKIEASK